LQVVTIGDICNPVYLALFLNSRAGIMQNVQFASGSAQRELCPNDIIQFVVYLPNYNSSEIDLVRQDKLAKKVIAANNERLAAQAKIGQAKCLIEEAILDK